MWSRTDRDDTPQVRAARIALALVLAVSLGVLGLHVHTEDMMAPCPQCVLLAGFALPIIALLLSRPQEGRLLTRVQRDTAPRALLLWSRRQLRGPPSAV